MQISSTDSSPSKVNTLYTVNYVPYQELRHRLTGPSFAARAVETDSSKGRKTPTDGESAHLSHVTPGDASPHSALAGRRACVARRRAGT